MACHLCTFQDASATVEGSTEHLRVAVKQQWERRYLDGAGAWDEERQGRIGGLVDILQGSKTRRRGWGYE